MISAAPSVAPPAPPRRDTEDRRAEFELLFHRVERHIRFLAERAHDDPDEVLAEVMLRAWERYLALRSASAPEPPRARRRRPFPLNRRYLLNIATNLIKDRWRRRTAVYRAAAEPSSQNRETGSSDSHGEDGEWLGDDSVDQDPIDSLVDPAALDPADAVLYSEQSVLLIAALAVLPADQLRAVRDVAGGLSLDVSAARQNVSPSSVSRARTRGLHRLRTSLRRAGYAAPLFRHQN